MLSVWDKNYQIRSQVPLTEIQSPKRANLKGKEIITNVKIIKHSLKRPREVESCPDTKSDLEFSSLYSTESISTKKHCPSDEKENIKVDCSIGILTSLLDENASRDDDLDVVNSDSSESFCNSPKDDDGNASTFVVDDVNEEDLHSGTLAEEPLVSQVVSLESDSKNTSSEDFTPKSNSNAHPRNRFAIHTKIKERFNINATKVEVKSRFFSQSSSPATPKMEISPPERPKIDKLAFKSPNQHRFERNCLSNMDKNTLSISSEEIMHKGRSSSNASAFSWRQQQFVRNQSMDNFSTLKAVHNQRNINQHFQPPILHCNPLVRHNSDGGSRIGGNRGDGNNQTVPMPDSDAYISRSLDNDCGQSDINQSITASTFFNMSRCPSMNLSESPGSQDEDGERGSQKHTPVNSPIESWIGSTETMHLPNYPTLPSLHVVCPAFLKHEGVRANSPMLEPNLLDNKVSRTCSPNLPIAKAPSRCLHRSSPLHQSARQEEHSTSAPVSPQINRPPRSLLAENFSVIDKE